MCEFCTQHGEGKKWYLQMKSYAEELVHEELSHTQQEIVESSTRVEWYNRLWESFMMPAITGVSQEEEPETAAPSTEIPGVRSGVERRKVEHFGQVLPIEDIERVVDMVDSITRIPCGCRFALTGKTNQRYHFGIGIDRWGVLGKFPDAASSLEVLDKEEVKTLFRKYDEEGLFHTIFTAVTPYVQCLCNCDHDCLNYRAYIEKGGPPRFLRAEYVCQVDYDLCNGCKSCMSQCQFGAQFYSSALAKVHIDPTKCFGCGVCRAACPDNAIALVPRQGVPEAADLWLR